MIFLTSTGFTNPQIFTLLLKNRKLDYSSACIIYTGIPEKKDHPIVQNTVNYLSNKNIREIYLLDVEFEDPSILLSYDLVLILGGNSAHLFYHLKKSGSDKYIKSLAENGKDVVGASAGAWYLSSGRKYANDFSFLNIDESYPYRVDSDGLNLIEGYLFPHYDMFCDRVEDLESKLVELEKRKQVNFIRLKNMDFIYQDNEGAIHTVINE